MPAALFMPVDLYAYAIKLLARREHSQKELQQKMAQKLRQKPQPDESETNDSSTVDSEAISTILNRLVTENLQSDVRYSEMLCRARQNQGYGRERIIAELRSKGIESEIITAQLRALPDEDLQQASAQLNKRFSLYRATQPPMKQQQRMKSYLLQKGYSFSVINLALAQFLAPD